LAEGIIRTRLMLLTNAVQQALPEKQFEGYGKSKRLRRSTSFQARSKRKITPERYLPKKETTTTDIPKLNLSDVKKKSSGGTALDFFNKITRKSPRTSERDKVAKTARPASTQHSEQEFQPSSSPRGTSPKGSPQNISPTISPRHGLVDMKEKIRNVVEDWAHTEADTKDKKRRGRSTSERPKRRSYKEKEKDRAHKKAKKRSLRSKSNLHREGEKEKGERDKVKRLPGRVDVPSDIAGPIPFSLSTYSTEFFSMMSEGARTLNEKEKTKHEERIANSGSIDLWSSLSNGYTVLAQQQEQIQHK